MMRTGGSSKRERRSSPVHDSVMSWVRERADKLQPPVLEVGAADINGSVRPMCPTPYVGVDIEFAPGVDVRYDGRHLPAEDKSVATVICTEVFEHCEDPVRLAAEIVRVLQPGGIALVTARGPGFQFHNPPDRWRFMPGALSELFTNHGCTAVEEEDPQVSGRFVEVVR